MRPIESLGFVVIVEFTRAHSLRVWHVDSALTSNFGGGGGEE